MPATTIAPPFQYFTNASGLALESGYIYIGTAGLPAESNPIPTYTNVGLTTTIAQPIRTSAGYAVSSGTPITIYVNALDYSITIRDKNGTLVFSSLSAAGSIGVLPVAQGGTGASNQAGALLNLGALASSTVAKTANYTVVLTDRGESIFCNGTFTLSLTAAATLGDGFSFAVVNVGSGTVTIDPNGSETIDGQATLALSQGQSCFVTTNGTEFRTLGLTGGAQLPAFNLLANNTGATAAPVAISKADLYPQSFQVGGTVAANALTATLQPTPITFRSATAGSGAINNRTVSTAVSLTIPSGATVGTSNGVESTLLFAAIDNAGTVELAVINAAFFNQFASEGILTTAAIAGGTAANQWYSQTAMTNVPYKLIGTITSTQATAGTWATAPSRIQGFGIAQQGLTNIKPGIVQYYYTEYTTYTSSATTIPFDNTIPQITEGVEIMTLSITPTNVNNRIAVQALCQINGVSGGRPCAAIFRDSVANALAVGMSGSNTSYIQNTSVIHDEIAGGINSRTYRVRVGDDSGTIYVNGNNTGRIYGGAGKCTLVVFEYSP